MEQNLPLQGKVALITGAARGIGAATATRLAAEGATVVVNYARAREAAEALVDRITAAGGKATAFQADVGQADQVQALFRHIDQAHDGRLDIVVNNAGVSFFSPADQSTEEQFDQIVDTNIRGVFLVTTEAIKRLSDGGRIILIGSGLADRSPMAGAAIYTMSKSALQGLTRAWARELGPRGIRVNLIQPGAIDTDMNPATGELAGSLVPTIALGRYGKPGEIADAIAFLAGPASTYVTGSIIDVDGGWKA